MNTTETCDLVNSGGVIQLKNIPYAESRDHDGLYAQIAVVVIWHPDGRLLIQKRGTDGEAPGLLDHVVGMVDSGEQPLDAAEREAMEETHVHLTHIRLIETGVNAYHRYQYLYTALATDAPAVPDDGEVTWARYMTEAEIRAEVARGAGFCMEFFDDIEKCRPWTGGYR